MDVSEILSPLNDAQRDAVAAENQNLLVLAAAPEAARPGCWFIASPG
jgi:hypothetical protein